MIAQWKRALLLGGWNLQKAIELAVTIEEMGEAHYGRLAARWQSSESLRTLFTKLAAEESAHGDRARLLFSSATDETDAASTLDHDCLEAIARAYFFSADGGALSGIESVASPELVLDRVLKFENATLHFYRGLRDVLGPSPAIDVMIAEEKRHAVEVMRAMSGAAASLRPAVATAANVVASR